MDLNTIDRNIVMEHMKELHDAKFVYYSDAFRILFIWHGGNTVKQISVFCDWEDRTLIYRDRTPTTPSIKQFIINTEKEYHTHFIKHFHPFKSLEIKADAPTNIINRKEIPPKQSLYFLTEVVNENSICTRKDFWETREIRR